MTISNFQLEDLYNQYEGKYKYNLSSACMPAISLEDLLSLYPERELVLEKLLNTPLDYSSQYGLEAARDAISENLYSNISSEKILLTTGASEAIFLLMNTLFTAGDAIIVQKPIYQSLYQIAADNEVQIIDWDLDLKTISWDLTHLESLIKKHPQVKALVINNPNNPVGTVFDKDQLTKITGLLDGRLLISDEVFLPISLRESQAACMVYEHGISISDLSKSFNVPGLRLGWIICHPESRRSKAKSDKGSSPLKELISLKNYLSLRNNTLSELIAPWLLNKTESITKKNKRIIQDNLNWIYSQEPETLFFDLSQKKENIASLCFFPKLKKELSFEELIAQGYFLVFGENFGSSYKDFCRVGLGNGNTKDIILI